jgi:hypothetical protein
MNTKNRISIWIVALFLVFSGIGLSSQKARAASGYAFPRTSLISVYHVYALATINDGLSSSDPLLRQASRGVSLTTLNVNDIDESRLIKAYNLQALARFSSLISRSVNDIDESRLIEAYSLQALARSSALTSLSVNDIAESRLIDTYSSRVRYYFELHPRPWR